MSDDASSREELQAAILGAFRGTIEPRKTTWRYRSAVLLAALATLPVVAIYLVALAAAAAMVWYPPDHSIIAWAIRIVGVGLGLVLARPILRWFAPSPPVVVATRRDEPLLFAFVDRVCETVGSPRPTEIVFDVDANAGVSLRRGLFSLPWNDLKLKIGLPLVRGMSLKQLAGILAHEFGHLSQTTGLRLATFATVVNNWFAHLLDEPATRLVRHRRALPQLLHQLVNGVLSVARAVGWMELARYHFRTLGVLSETATSNLSREMEHDADRSSARLIGSEAAAEALDRTLFLSAAEHTALNDLDFNFRERRLPDDLPEWIVSRLDWLTPNLLHAIVMRYEVERADAMATHPGRAARVAEWKTQAVAGVFDYEGPASLLFRDLPSLSRRATRELYSYLFGSQLDLLRIDSTAEALRRRQEIYDQAEARGRFWPVPSLLSRPFPLAGDKGTPLAPHADFAAVLATSRATAEREALEYRAALSKYAAAERRLEALRLPEAAASARVPFASRDFGLTSATSAGVRDAQAIAVKEQVDQIAAMATFEQASSQRLFAAIALISVADGSASTVSEHAEDDPRIEAERLLQTLRRLTVELPKVLILRTALITLVVLRPFGAELMLEQTYRRRRREADRTLRTSLAAIEEALRDDLYPFSYGHGGTTIANYLVAPSLGEQGPRSRCDAAQRVVENYEALLERILGRLAGLAEASESSRGLKPLTWPEQLADEASKLTS